MTPEDLSEDADLDALVARLQTLCQRWIRASRASPNHGLAAITEQVEFLERLIPALCRDLAPAYAAVIQAEIEGNSLDILALHLNDMRLPKIEQLLPVARGTKEELQALIARETVEPYVDGGWAKRFRKGGPLEWYNHPEYGIGRIVEIPEARSL